MPRDPRLAESGVLTENVTVKESPGLVVSITIAFTGATAGARCYLRDGTDGAAPVAVPFVLGASNGTITKEWPEGKLFETGIYWDNGPAAPDTVFAELTFK